MYIFTKVYDLGIFSSFCMKMYIFSMFCIILLISAKMYIFGNIYENIQKRMKMYSTMQKYMKMHKTMKMYKTVQNVWTSTKFMKVYKNIQNKYLEENLPNNIKCTLRWKFVQYLHEMHIINYCRSMSFRADYNHCMVYFDQSCRIRTNSGK